MMLADAPGTKYVKKKPAGKELVMMSDGNALAKVLRKKK